jgi:hypothetical protein
LDCIGLDFFNFIYIILKIVIYIYIMSGKGTKKKATLQLQALTAAHPGGV